ncbi:MAG: cupin domain-containing protein [Planctomycetota bacterium]
MSATTYENLASEVSIPGDGTSSRSLHQGDDLKTVLFGFSRGQELSEHTASRAAVLHFLEGEARVTLGDDVVEARPGTWIHMPAELPHSILARTEVKMLLLLLRAG